MKQFSLGLLRLRKANRITDNTQHPNHGAFQGDENNLSAIDIKIATLNRTRDDSININMKSFKSGQLNDDS